MEARSTPSGAEEPSERAAGGERTDVGALFVDERVPMVRLASLLVGSRAVAEEVVQDAFVTVGDRWDSIERPGAYLRTSVVRGCAAVLRRRSIEQRYSPRLHEANSTELPTHLIELRDALGRLTDRQRVVIVLRYFLDLPDDEIARTIEARPSTVRSIARRALSTLREELT